jgi:glutaminyl-tRNA synthetase
LYEYAIKLIKEGKAYVCHQAGEEMAEGREKKIPSPWRDTSVEENLRKFSEMKDGKYEEGKATLRMKMDMNSDNTCMRDLVAYRY